ncbi:MAG: lipoprotein [Shewanella sp.]|nr:lipoprotein [Shewanella sp.]MCF1430847.1 lipoprotein [Shewanella sp.]MCF1437232.1 lipoprotein [Shewanella sp.]MCF1456123.1 lipoprotein [Shewanella sp.]
MRLFLLILLASLVSAGCGQKGPLYKAPAMQDNQAGKLEKKEQNSKE